MQSFQLPVFCRLVFASTCALTLIPSPAWSQNNMGYCPSFLAVENAPKPESRASFSFSPYTYHWSRNPEHKPVILVSLDEQLPGDRFCGIGFFSNSFGQPSVYAYFGKQFNQWLGIEPLFVKLSAGILYGYVEPFQGKVPLNYHGFSPAIVPTIGYKLGTTDSVQVNILGNAGLMFSYGRSF